MSRREPIGKYILQEKEVSGDLMMNEKFQVGATVEEIFQKDLVNKENLNSRKMRLDEHTGNV